MSECCCRLSDTHYGCVGPITLRGEWITHDKYSYIASLSLQVNLPTFYKAWLIWKFGFIYTLNGLDHACTFQQCLCMRRWAVWFLQHGPWNQHSLLSLLSLCCNVSASEYSKYHVPYIYYEKSSSVTETVAISPMQYDRLLPRSTQNKQFILYKHIHGFTENIYPKSIIRKLI